jgi:hypothetical protein
MRRGMSLALALMLVAGQYATDSGRVSADVAQPDASSTAPQSATRPAAVGAQESVNAHGAATKAFLDRINEYVTFHNNVEKMVPPLKETPSPEEIAQREAALGAALIKQRPNAKEGDFFLKVYQPYLLHIVKEDFSKRPLADRKALIVELPKGLKVAVNTIYPTSLPLATFPANLLKALPELPKELEYRIVARHLILLDAKGSVIVDLMRDVFPIPQ